MKTYLIVEDDPIKENSYRKFSQRYANRGIQLRAKASPNGAITLLMNPAELSAIDGVIADFQLGGERPDNHHRRIEVTAPDSTPYTCSTGLGVLDWVHSVAPDMPLWALTNDAATHAPLFMSAASLWLDAKPLNVERLKVGTPLADALAEELLAPERYGELNPHWERIDNARSAFAELLNTPYSGEESFDWLTALTHLKPGTAGFIPTLTDTIRQVTLNPKLNAYAHTLAPVMAQWQLLLEEIYQDFPVDRKEHLWPALDPDALPRNLNAWSQFNPITEFLGDHSECKEFFKAADVRMALTKWRTRGQVP